MKYGMTEEMVLRLTCEFTYHTPKEDQAERYEFLRGKALALAHDVATLTPPSREQGFALTKLGECVMWANAAIARNE